MERKEINQAKSKRVRINPVKKWNMAEEKALIEFLTENRDFEKPTAQAYYSRFATATNMSTIWKLIRAKVRNMRMSYNKAKEWEGSTGAGSMEGETIRATLLKKCGFFFELEEIFGARLAENAVVEDSLDPTIEMNDEEENTSPNIIPDNEASTSRKGIYSRTGLSEILKMQSEMLQLRKERTEKEINLKESELALKKREIELKEKEIESNERLKIMELEMKERIAMEELKLKYK